MTADEDDDFIKLVEHFHDSVVSKSVPTLSSIVSSLCLSDPSQPAWKYLRNTIYLFSFQEHNPSANSRNG